MEKTKIVGIIVLVIVIVAGAWITIERMKGTPKAPDYVLKRPIDRIDEKSLEVITQTIGQWEGLGQRAGKYKNPKTGAYTMVNVMTCRSCGAKIPAVLIPDGTPPDQRDAMENSYLCPKCGKHPM